MQNSSRDPGGTATATHRERRARARALAYLDTTETTVDPEAVRRAAALWQRCPYIDLRPERDCTPAGVNAWGTTVAHLRRLGYDVRPVVPDTARQAWRRWLR